MYTTQTPFTIPICESDYVTYIPPKKRYKKRIIIRKREKGKPRKDSIDKEGYTIYETICKD